eukprot:13223741-Heterocapsa_arctica.AAC.1
MEFDKTLTNDEGMKLPAAMELLSGRLFDALIGNPMARERGWKPLERMINQSHAWYPWGTLKKHLLDPDVWMESMTDKELWT